jgi:hypothetical protein
MSRPVVAVVMLACACALSGPANALAQDPAAEVPDIAVSEAQPVTTPRAGGPAAAASGPELWATVNICDTPRSPDAMGVRASMPGNGTRQRTYMRFRAQYWSRSREDWAPVGGSGVSPWVSVGKARYERRQAGWTFEFAPPPQGVTFTMRAIVEFQWRRVEEPVAGGERGKRKRMVVRRSRAGETGRSHRRDRSRVVRTVTRATETGIEGVEGGDPAGTSKAMCLIY